jgi:glycogen operon protein
VIALRRRHPSLTANRFFSGEPPPGRDIPDVAWHGAHLGEAPWDDPEARALAMTIAGIAADEPDLHAVFNMSDVAFDAELPDIPGRRWHVALDTALASPHDIVPPGAQRPCTDRRYLVQPRSVAVLEARA